MQLSNRKRKEFILFNHEPSVTFKRYSIHGMWRDLGWFREIFQESRKTNSLQKKGIQPLEGDLKEI